ncbi:MAG: hypothetical protein HKO56_01895, partial [Bacteroidia bacterium]|nr:hypothetical protein [Bacteroidia bacterium]
MKHLKNILKKHFAFIFPILPVVLLAIFIYSCGTGTTEESSSEIVEEAAGVIAAPCELIDAATAHDYFTRYMATKPDSIVTKGIVLNNSNVRGIQYLNSWIIPSPVGYRA